MRQVSLLVVVLLAACAARKPPRSMTATVPRRSQIEVVWHFEPIPQQNMLHLTYELTNRSSVPVGLQANDGDPRPTISALMIRHRNARAVLLGISGVIVHGRALPIRLVMVGAGETLRGETTVFLPNWDDTGFLRRTGLEQIYLVVPIFVRDSSGRPENVLDWEAGPRPLRLSDFPGVVKKDGAYPRPWGRRPPSDDEVSPSH